MATKRRRTFQRDYLRSVFREWWSAVIAVGSGIMGAVGLIVETDLSPFLWVSVVLLGIVVAQARAARRVWISQYGDVRGLVDDCLRAGRELELELVGKEEVAHSALRVLRWMLDARRVLQEKAPAYAGELTLDLAKDESLARSAAEAAIDEGKELSQQDARSLLRPLVDQLSAIRKQLGNP